MVRKIIMACVGASLLALGLSVPAGAHDGHHAPEPWTPNNDAAGTTIVDSHTVELVTDSEDTPKGTSVETQDLGLAVSDGAEVSFEYETISGTGCGDNNLRVFVSGPEVGTPKDNNSWDLNQPDGTQCGSEGVVTFTIESGGVIKHAGVVLDNDPPQPGTVRVSNLTIDGELISFLPRPRVTPAEPTLVHPVCEDSGTLTIPDVEGVIYFESESESAVDPGEYDAEHGEFIAVFATADEGYALAEDREYGWILRPVAKGCSGEDGEDGADGEDGEDGEVVVKLPTRIDTGR